MPATPNRPEIERGPDRREGPRRADEVILHYTRERLIQAAVVFEAAWSAGTSMDVADLVNAVRRFREAEAATHEAGVR